MEGALSQHLRENEPILREAFSGADDVVLRRFTAAQGTYRADALLIYVDGLTDKEQISEQLLERLLNGAGMPNPDDRGPRLNAISATSVEKVWTFAQVIDAVLDGRTAVLLDGARHAVIADTQGWERRKVEEPPSETVMRGPRDGFTETLRMNTALVRRRIRDRSLKVEGLTIGRRTRTTVAMVYVGALANPAVVDEVRRRLKAIDIDAILESGTIQELIQDRRWTLYPLLLATERPDRCVNALLQGRVVILTDGTPFALIAPTVVGDFIESPQDYYSNFYLVGFLRWLRVVTQLLSTALPGLYVAMVSFHPELIPTRLALTIAGTRQGIPFPANIEMLIILLGAELLIEAAVRLPRTIGQTIGIVGGIILGDAAVRAGIVSSVIIIVMAATLIMGFTAPAPQLNAPRRLIRIALFVLGSSFGLYGLMLGGLAVFVHLLTLESFGVPYLSPHAPIRDGVRALLLRPPWWLRTRRPEEFRPLDDQSQQPPGRPRSPDLMAGKHSARRRRR